MPEEKEDVSASTPELSELTGRAAEAEVAWCLPGWWLGLGSGGRDEKLVVTLGVLELDRELPCGTGRGRRWWRYAAELLLREVFAANEGLLLFGAKVLAEAPYLGIAKLVGGTPARGSS